MVSLSDFSNRLDRPGLKTLADADQLESVREMKVWLAHMLFTVLRNNNDTVIIIYLSGNRCNLENIYVFSQK